MVAASKRFTIHRSANVLTLALKRFANFSGGKITKVPLQAPTNMAFINPVVLPATYRVSRTWNIQNSWTCAISCLVPKENLWSTDYMLFWSTLGSAVMQGIITATLRYSYCFATVLLLGKYCLCLSDLCENVSVTRTYLFSVVSQASNGQWYLMNDSSVTTSDIRTVLNQQAYVLFYIKWVSTAFDILRTQT